MSVSNTLRPVFLSLQYVLALQYSTETHWHSEQVLAFQLLCFCCLKLAWLSCLPRDIRPTRLVRVRGIRAQIDIAEPQAQTLNQGCKLIGKHGPMLLTLEDERDIPGVWAVGSQQERPLGASINRIGFGVCYTKVFLVILV